MCSTTRRGTASPGRLSLQCMHRGVMHFMSYLCSLHTAQLTHALADWLLQLKARKHCYFSDSRNSGNICRTETACTHTAHAGSASNKPRTEVPYSLCHSAAHANVTQHHCLYMTSKKTSSTYDVGLSITLLSHGVKECTVTNVRHTRAVSAQPHQRQFTRLTGRIVTAV